MTRKRREESSATLAAAHLATYCPDLSTWPTSWRGQASDVIAGEQTVAVLTPFLLALVAQGLSRKTRNLRRDNLWRLGGGIIGDTNDAPKLRKRAVKDLTMEAVAGDEGPLIHGGSGEQEQRSFDSTCKKLYRFLAAHADDNPA